MDEAQNSKRHKSSTRNRSSFAMHRLIGRKAEAASYSDDASNNRVRSEINGTAYELLFNLTGQKVAITSGGAVVEEDTHLGAAPSAAFFNGSLNFEHQDWLGTERFLTGSDGSPIGNYTSYPFGDGYVDNGVDLDPYHFAGMDHDYESTLDHATFREYASAGGRWLSPDPYQGSYDWSNPQSLNRYSYALNDPLSLSDPAGLDGGVGSTSIPIAGVGNFVTNVLNFLFYHPSFNGSLKPRPNAQPWDEYNITYGSNIAGALGLPDQTCEFGPCGGGGFNLQSGTATSLASPILFNIPPQIFQYASLAKSFLSGISNKLCTGAFAFAGKEFDGGLVNVFAGAIYEGSNVNTLQEVGLGGEGPTLGGGKITNPTTGVSQYFIYGGESISAGPLAGLNTGLLAGKGFGGFYYEGHILKAAVGSGGYVEGCR